MKYEICTESEEGKWHCVPWKFIDPDWKKIRISYDTLIDILAIGRLQDEGGPYPIPWLEELGVGRDQQRELSTLTQIGTLAAQLSPNAQAQVGSMVQDLIGKVDLPKGVSLRAQASAS